METNLKRDKGVAGLMILLSLVVMLFVIGLLVMIFALMGGEMKDVDSIKGSELSGTVTQDALTFSDGGTSLTECASHNLGVVTVSAVINETGEETVPTAQYTTANCILTGISGSIWNATAVNVTYTYTYAGTAWDVMNGTIEGIVNVTDWYDIFIVIGAMVVLILLTVIIIVAIRGSGMMDGGVATGNASRNYGSA